MASMTKSLGGKGSELAGAPPTVDMDVGFRVRAEDFYGQTAKASLTIFGQHRYTRKKLTGPRTFRRVSGLDVVDFDFPDA